MTAQRGIVAHKVDFATADKIFHNLAEIHGNLRRHPEPDLEPHAPKQAVEMRLHLIGQRVGRVYKVDTQQPIAVGALGLFVYYGIQNLVLHPVGLLAVAEIDEIGCIFRYFTVAADVGEQRSVIVKFLYSK